MQAITWWLTGLPGAGKTTLAQQLASTLREQSTTVCVLDGDALRSGVCSDLGFSCEDRAENVRRTAHLAALLNSQGLHVAVAMISPSAAARQTARQIVGEDRFKEIHVSTPLEVCRARDPKGLYARSAAGKISDLTGAQAPYDVPQAPHLRIDTSSTRLPEAVSQMLGLLA